MRRCFPNLCIAFLLTACTSPPTPSSSQNAALYALLTHRFPDIPSQESAALAKDVTTYVNRLEARFGRTTSPYVHNLLVNLGVKKKGLCWHYADALYLHLLHRYPHYRVHLIGTHIGDYWREHNAVALTNRDNNLSRAVILDAWRTPGKLVAVPIKEDTYKWEHRKEREAGN